MCFNGFIQQVGFYILNIILISPLSTGNNWGVCDDGVGRVGCGDQEEFRACADISLTNSSPSVPASQGKSSSSKSFWSKRRENTIRDEKDFSLKRKSSSTYSYSLSDKNSYSFFSFDLLPEKTSAADATPRWSFRNKKHLNKSPKSVKVHESEKSTSPATKILNSAKTTTPSTLPFLEITTETAINNNIKKKKSFETMNRSKNNRKISLKVPTFNEKIPTIKRNKTFYELKSERSKSHSYFWIGNSNENFITSPLLADKETREGVVLLEENPQKDISNMITTEFLNYCSKSKSMTRKFLKSFML